MKKILAVCILCLAINAQSAPFKKVLGQDFPQVKGKDLNGSAEIDLKGLLAQEKIKGAVVFFTSVKCPVAVAYEGRINDLATKYAGVAPVIALNANASSESEEAQAAYAKEKGYKHPVVWDAGSSVAKAIGAGCTPEFYLIDKQGKVVFHGPLDDSQDPEQITKHLLANAVEALVNGKPIPAEDAEVQAFGCGIKFAK